MGTAPAAHRVRRVPALGFAIAGHLALYQWEILPDVWEPFFGGGSRVILDSPISRILPVPDAALGAFGYALDAITGGITGGITGATGMASPSPHGVALDLIFDQ